MSWLSKLLPPKIQVDEQKNSNKVSVPEGTWCKCKGCNEILYHTDLDHNLQICPKCNYHHYISARLRIASLLDQGEQREIAANIRSMDFLKFTDRLNYTDRLAEAQSIGETEALIAILGHLNQQQIVLACFDFNFIGGSMGSVVGEKFVRCVQTAIEHNCPFICVAASGGARMQEGLMSLMQMAKTIAALQLLRQQHLPFISVLTNPTFGGVSASFAFLGDIIIAEPGAYIGFAGSRVIEQTVREKLPDNFQTAEFLLANGAIDLIVNRHHLKQQLSEIITLLLNKEF